MTEETEKHADHEDNGQQLIEMSPIQLLAIILKAKLKDRISDEEVETICSVFFQTLKAWWGEQ